MTREKAKAAVSALNDIDGFEAFISMVERDIAEVMDTCDMDSIRCPLMNMLEAELERRKKVLESL